MERAELAAWLRLLESPGIGWDGARRLLTRAGSALAVFDLPAAALRDLLTVRQQQSLAGPPPHLDELTARTWAWLHADAAHQLLLLGDEDYPEPLLQTADPPLLLYLHGRRELLRGPMLAIVGSRDPTVQGRDNARSFARQLSEAGLTIVSGLALGIDGAAHEGALDGRGGTIAVLGTGVDEIYPRRHQELAERVVAEGLLVSEYPLGTPALPPNFPRRNRIIAGLSQGCLVVEAAVQSGSLITARLASEAGREVFAIPGSIHSPLSRGCHALIRQGAKLVESPVDVLDELPRALEDLAPMTTTPAAYVPASSGLGREQKRLLELIGYDPITLDELQARSGQGAGDLSAWLLELELAGLVARLAGQQFQRRATG